MAVAHEWDKVIEQLDTFSVYQVAHPTLLAMKKLVGMIKDDPAFADVRPMRSHISLILSRGSTPRRVYVGWNDQYIVAFVGPRMEISEGTRIGEEHVVRVLREHLDRLEPQVKFESTEEALKEVKSLLGVQVDQLSPDGIVEAVAPNDAVSWTAVPDWESLEDLDIFARVGLNDACSCSQLLVVTEASFSRVCGAFRLAGRDLSEFIRTHHAAYGECFFDGDVVVIDCGQGAVWLFHHEGAYAKIPPPRKPG
jgi:hypothetical protein